VASTASELATASEEGSRLARCDKLPRASNPVGPEPRGWSRELRSSRPLGLRGSLQILQHTLALPLQVNCTCHDVFGHTQVGFLQGMYWIASPHEAVVQQPASIADLEIPEFLPVCQSLPQSVASIQVAELSFSITRLQHVLAVLGIIAARGPQVPW
jgi:hypothetical protein